MNPTANENPCPRKARVVSARLSPAQVIVLDQIARDLGLTAPGLLITSTQNMGKVLVACAFGLLAHERDQDAPAELKRMLQTYVIAGRSDCKPCWSDAKQPLEGRVPSRPYRQPESQSWELNEPTQQLAS